jgi:hypothetical protein
LQFCFALKRWDSRGTSANSADFCFHDNFMIRHSNDATEGVHGVAKYKSELFVDRMRARGRFRNNDVTKVSRDDGTKGLRSTNRFQYGSQLELSRFYTLGYSGTRIEVM